MVLPGIQALFGFQLIAVFNDRFQQLEGLYQLIHFIALVLVALSVAIIMTPAAITGSRNGARCRIFSFGWHP
jgi:hypothetical protein